MPKKTKQPADDYADRMIKVQELIANHAVAMAVKYNLTPADLTRAMAFAGAKVLYCHAKDTEGSSIQDCFNRVIAAAMEGAGMAHDHKTQQN